MKAIKSGGKNILGLALFIIGLLALSTPARASVTLSPRSVNFGSVAVGAASNTVNVTLTNTGSRRMNIVRESVSSSQFSYLGPASFTLRPSNSLTIGVSFNPTAAQSYSGALTFVSGAGSTFTVSLSGTGASTQTSTITLTIGPTSVSLLPGAQQTFIATTHGGNNDGVTWSATCGTFTSDGWYGYYTAPATAGSCSVTGRLTYIPTVSISAPVTVTAAATVAPSITTQPANRTITPGQTATFSVTAAGTSPFTYQWNKNGAAISGATSSSYTTPATATSDSGAQFGVVVANSVGSVTSAAATLTVNAASVAPSITTQPASTTVIAGQTAWFSVNNSGTSPFTYQWKKNGTAVSGATSSSYTTAATTASDSGAQFTVTVTNSVGSATSQGAMLTVHTASVAPSITTQPASRTVTAGQTASFSLSVSGTSPFTYQWNKNGAAISGATSSTYTTPATATSDSGAQFSIVVTNAVGSITSNAAVLTVNAGTLLLTVNPTSLSFGNVNLSASATKSATITNSGTASVTISGVSYSGAGFTTSGLSSGLILSPGQAAALNVTFNPTTAGSVSGSIAIASNATNSPANLAMSGTGVQLITHQANLSWIPSTSIVAGYQVYSSTVSGGPYTKLTATAVNLSSYTDSTVQSGNTYYYVVTAVDSSSVASAYSNQAVAVIP